MSLPDPMMSYHVLERLLALDARIHLHVMGHVWDDARCRQCGWPLGTAPYACQPESCGFRPHPLIPADTPPPYASDLTTAWRVVEHLRQRGWWVTIQALPGGYHVTYRHQSGGGALPHPSATAETVPEAICLAALQVAETGRMNV